MSERNEDQSNQVIAVKMFGKCPFIVGDRFEVFAGQGIPGLYSRSSASAGHVCVSKRKVIHLFDFS